MRVRIPFLEWNRLIQDHGGFITNCVCADGKNPQGRLRGQGVTARVIVALRDDRIRVPQVGTLMPVDVAASKKAESV